MIIGQTYNLSRPRCIENDRVSLRASQVLLGVAVLGTRNRLTRHTQQHQKLTVTLMEN
jgi:hypothetical protein